LSQTPRVDDACSPLYEYPAASEHMCEPFLCGKGVCQILSNGFRGCKCDTNATPPNCFDTCCKDCGTNGRCLKNLENVEVCTCQTSFTGEFCEAYLAGDVCDTTYQPLDLAERTCDGGRTCVYGICVTSTQGQSFCICDDGASGPFCDEVCCLDCGEHGTCGIDQTTGNQTCVCDEQYTGETCSELSMYRNVVE